MLRSILRTMVGALHERKMDNVLFRFDDWHQHDGYVTKAIPIGWAALESVLLSDEKLWDSRQRDEFVRWAYYPDDVTFLLRYDICDSDEEPEVSEPLGDCDLCAGTDTIEEILASVGGLVSCLEVVSAKDYFDEIYAG